MIKATISKPNNIIKNMQKTNYYQELYNDIKTEMSYYTNQSGFEDDILDDTFTVDEIKEETNAYIKNIYYGKETKVDTSNFENKLNKKIDAYIESENFTITNRNEIDNFVKEMAKIYVSKIKINDYLTKIHSLIKKANRVLNILIIVLIPVLILLLLVNRIILKNKQNQVVLYTNSFLLIGIYAYIHKNIDIKHIFIYNKLLSKLLGYIINNFLTNLIYIAILCFVLATVISTLRREE